MRRKKQRGADAQQSNAPPPLYFTPPPPKKKRGGVKSAGSEYYVRPAKEIPVVAPPDQPPPVDMYGRSEAEILNAIEHAQRLLTIAESYTNTSPGAISALEARRRNIEGDVFWLAVVRGEQVDPLGVEALGEWAPFRNQQQLQNWRDTIARLAWWREQRELGTFVNQPIEKKPVTSAVDYWSETQGRIVDDLD